MTDIYDIINNINKSRLSDDSFIRFAEKGFRFIPRSVNGLIRIYKFKSDSSDFYLFEIKNDEIKNSSKLEREDLLVEQYLEKFRKIKFILSRHISEDIWLAIPENRDIAFKEGLIGPQVIFKCNNCDIFDQVEVFIVREKNTTYLIYSNHDYSYDFEQTEKLKAHFIEANKKTDLESRPNVSGAKLQAYELACQEIKNKIEKDFKTRISWIKSKVRNICDKTGCIFEDVKIRCNLLEIVWRPNGSSYTYNTITDLDLNIASAGICLSGQDEVFDFTSLISVVKEGEESDQIVIVR
ncbi:MAG: hypothetical protein ACOCV1_00595 [Bacillota bacterium]